MIRLALEAVLAAAAAVVILLIIISGLLVWTCYRGGAE